MSDQDIYYIDGRFVPADRAVLPVNDLALLRGYGVFDFIRTYGGRPFLLEEHLARLEESARLIRIPFPWSREEVAEIVRRTLARNPPRESNIRIIVTGGPSPDFLLPEGRPRLLILAGELKPSPPRWYTRGVKVITLQGRRAIPSAKTLNYLSTIVALQEAAEQGAVEAILVDRSGRVGEGQTASVFAWIGGELVTNEKGVLPGVTRSLVLKLAETVFPVRVRDFTHQELLSAGEVFMTATNKELVPIVEIDEIRIAAGRPGDRTRRLMEIFRDYTARFAAL